MKKLKYYSEAMMVAHMMMKDAYELGFATEEDMRIADEECLIREPEVTVAAPVRARARTSARSKAAAPSDTAPRVKTGGAKSRPRKSGAKVVAATFPTAKVAPAKIAPAKVAADAVDPVFRQPAAN